MREQITNHNAVIKALAQLDFAERAGEADDETPIQSIKRHYTNALLAMPDIDNRGDYAWDPSEPHNIIDAITAYGEEKAANIYASFYADLGSNLQPLRSGVVPVATQSNARHAT